MTARLLKGGDVLLADGIIQQADILIGEGKVLAVGRDLNPDKADQVEDCHGAIITPGLIDIQVNGGGGVLFNEAPTLDGLKQIAQAHLRLGTTQFLPTLISDDLDVVRRGIAAVDAAIAAGFESIIGIHLEGPFLSPEKRGIHLSEHMRPLKDADIDLICSPRNGVTLITVAPEQVTPDQIRTLTSRGVIVSLGHSNASASQAADAIDAGARGFTHLYNAMSQLTSREPGMVGAALTNDEVWTSLILDGRHIARASTELVFRARDKAKCVLVTDAMPVAGTNNKSFELQGRTILVEDGRCVDAKGTLAGAALNLPYAIRHAMTYEQVSREEAIRMASKNPAEFLMLDRHHGSLEVGRRADLVCFDESFHVQKVMQKGNWIEAEPIKSSSEIAAR